MVKHKKAKKKRNRQVVKEGKGRPRANIDLDAVEKLASIHCTIAEIAYFLDIPESTLKNRADFTTIYKKGQAVGKISLRRKQFKLADKSAAMAIWLGKQYLEQKEQDQPDQDWFSEELEIVSPSEQATIKNRMRFLN